MDDIRLTLQLKRTLHQQLKATVEQHPSHLTLNEWIREAIEEKLQREQPEQVMLALHVLVALQAKLFSLIYKQAYDSQEMTAWVLEEIQQLHPQFEQMLQSS